MGLRKIKKEVAKNKLMFPLGMYNSLPGSIVITSYILNNEKPDIKEVRKLWKKVEKHGLPFGLEDHDYIDKVLSLFRCKTIPDGYSAFVQSSFNALVCPFIDGEIYPLREDGFYAATLRKGKIYPITKEVIQNGNDEQHLEQSSGEVL